MEYRTLPKGSEKISVIGMGSSYIGEKSEEEIIQVVHEAIKNGINYFDLAAGYASTFPAYGKAFKGIRDQVYLQIHFGADYTSGEYGWTTNLEQIKKAVQWQLDNLQTDYIDFGFIHCLDEESDVDEYIQNGVLDYVKSLKEKGIIHHLGLSTHTPAIANKILDMNLIDVMMFSINPAYDYKLGEYSRGSELEREQLYKRCEKEKVGITVMKPYCGGQLLDKDKSPFKQALTPIQCIQYALDKPAVLCVLPGFASVEDLHNTLKFFNATQEEKDYSIIGSFTPVDAIGHCVYCKHCHPCPMHLDVALINKYYDLTKLGDDMAKQHYLNLEKHASDCIQCGHCNSRCPFHVNQMQRMNEIQDYFGI